MFNLVPFAYKIAGIHSEYKIIHGQIVSNSLINIIKRLTLQTDYCHCAEKLDELLSLLIKCSKEIAVENDIEVEVGLSQIALPDIRAYIKALTESIELLKRLCQFHCNKVKSGLNYDQNKYRQVVIKYDNSIQEYQRIGIRLNNIFVKY